MTEFSDKPSESANTPPTPNPSYSNFSTRHNGPSQAETAAMLEALNLPDIDTLIEKTVPASIASRALDLPAAKTEQESLAYLKELAQQNKIYDNFIGMGYYGTYTPAVIQRNVLENPGWYTAYTPYQPEISQGRLEGLLNFQQMVMDITGMEIANASLLDEATAAAEAMTMLKRVNKKSKSNSYFVDETVHPQTLDVIRTRAEYFGFEIIVGKPETELNLHDVFAVQLQYPGSTGEVKDIEPIIAQAHEQGALVAVASDLMALLMLKTPGEMDADVVLGNSQRFGVPMGFGGPHAAFFATRDAYKRSLPGRIIGVSQDSKGNTALRMAMQTREQHIRREKATSNICTAQALLANIAGFYAVYHGPEGLKAIATQIHSLTSRLALSLQDAGFKLRHDSFFDTLCIEVGSKQDEIYETALANQMNLRLIGDDAIGISIDETTSEERLEKLVNCFASNTNLQSDAASYIPDSLVRQSTYLEHPVFHEYRSETEMMRYLKRLENKDYSLVHGMIPLGSCTMKLNAASEMMPVSWPEFANIHPFAPSNQTVGYQKMITELEDWLVNITGYDAICMQPNSGAQGEYAGLLAIRKYFESIGESHRDICLIPLSAHGTNPASANMMGMKVVAVASDEAGNIDVADLQVKAEEHSDNLAALMITYPSTHGVFEEEVKKVCEIIHEHGGQVYMDGANMNAQVGLTSPGFIGSDVSHLNLHKTFCIPHGGGGPGMGPIGAKAHLAPFVSNHAVSPVNDNKVGAVSAAPYGSPLILPISWAYISMMGAEGLTEATELAILNANYIANALEPHYPILFKGKNGYVAHECIIDIRDLKEATEISEEDIAKRLMDYGFHAPTMSFPVAGTLMIEPTESESKAELDRFIEAMISIRKEIADVEAGIVSAEDSVLRHAPHTLTDLVDAEWNRAYSREQAVFPMAQQRGNKYWPTVNRVDNVFGDRNFICSCPPMEDYM